jgi:ribosomal protein S18 acetylase RimI-like enzyme
VIRAGTAADVDAILALWRAADAVPTVTDDAGAIVTLIEHDPEALIVYEADGEIVATLVAAWNGWRGSFWRLAVRPDHRRGGIASELVRRGEKRFARLGAKRLDAILVSDEASALAFWQSLGYSAQHDRLRSVRDL